MINLNIKNAIDSKKILKFRTKVKYIIKKVKKNKNIEENMMGWIDLPAKTTKKELDKIVNLAKDLHKKASILVVVGIGGSYAGAKAAIEMVKGKFQTNVNPKVIFVGNSLSPRDLEAKLKFVKNKRFAINVISKSGETFEPLLVFRMFKNLLEKQVGPVKAQKLIFVTTNKKNGKLLEIAKTYKYNKFVIPENVGGRFSTLSVVGLFPMAFAGLDIHEMISGARKATEQYLELPLIKNDAFKYGVTRFLLSKKYELELFAEYDVDLERFNIVLRHLVGESEGKDGKGLFPINATYSTDLHSIEQYIQQGRKNVFETLIISKEANSKICVVKSECKIDKLAFLERHKIHNINLGIHQAVLKAHTMNAQMPTIVIEIEKINENNFGYLVTFFHFAIMMSAFLLQVNPFDQPGVETYKENVKAFFKTIKNKGKNYDK